VAVTTATPAGQCFSIAVDDTHVFAATRNGYLARADKDVAPGPATTIDTAAGTVSNADPVAIALFGDRVYWTHWLNNPDSGAVRSVTKDGGDPLSIVELHPEGVAADGSDAYWALPYSPGAVREATTTLASAADLAGGQSGPRGVALDATHVYWVNGADRTVRRALR
jgi:hypothetical protein